MEETMKTTIEDSVSNSGDNRPLEEDDDTFLIMSRKEVEKQKAELESVQNNAKILEEKLTNALKTISSFKKILLGLATVLNLGSIWAFWGKLGPQLLFLIIFMILITLLLMDLTHEYYGKEDHRFLQIQNLVKTMLETEQSMSKPVVDGLKPFIQNSIDTRNASGYTNLHEASQNGLVDEVRILLKLGANINERIWGKTSFHLAIKNGHFEVAKLLLENGADVNEMSNRITPLHKAAEDGHVEMAEFLIQNGANIEAKTGCHEQDAICTCFHRDCENTPLHFATEMGHFKVVELLLQHGADVNAENKRYMTSLHLAACNMNAKIVQILLKHGAKKDAKDCQGFGKTPLQLAEQNRLGNFEKFEEVFQLLK